MPKMDGSGGSSSETVKMSVKRKFSRWLMQLSTNKEDKSFSSAVAQHCTPDVVDITGLLRSAGFRLNNVDISQPARAQSAVAGCKVVVKCPVSGLSVTLESDGGCRCPKSTGDDCVSTWCVVNPASPSPSASQESLNKTEQAGSSVLPEVPGAVAEVAAWAVRCVMRLLEEEVGTGAPSQSSAGGRSAKRQLRASLSAGSRLYEASDPDRLGAQMAHSLSLDEMEWQASSLQGPPLSSKQPSTSPQSSSSAQPVLHDHLTIASTSGATSMPRSDSVEYFPEDEKQFLENDVFVAPQPRRQSSTLEEYELFKRNLQTDTQGVKTPRTSLGSVDSVTSEGVASVKSSPADVCPGGACATVTAATVDASSCLPPLLAQAKSIQRSMNGLINNLEQWVSLPEAGGSSKASKASRMVTRPNVKPNAALQAKSKGNKSDALSDKVQTSQRKAISLPRTPRPPTRSTLSTFSRASVIQRPMPPSAVRKEGLKALPEISPKASPKAQLKTSGTEVQKNKPKSSCEERIESPRQSSRIPSKQLTALRRLSGPDSLRYLRPPSNYECKHTPPHKNAS